MKADSSHSEEYKLIQIEGGYNVNNSLYAVLDLRYFRHLFSSPVPNSYKDILAYPDFKDDTVVIEFYNSANDNLSKEQMDLADLLIRKENEIADEIYKSIYIYYESIYPVYLEGATFNGEADPLVSDFLPKIVRGKELDDKIRLNSIIIYPASIGKDKIGFDFWCSWDEEHGLGVLMKGDKVIKVGIIHDVTPPFIDGQ